MDFVSGINKLSNANRVKAHISADPQLDVNPKFLDSEYNISEYTASNTKNSQAVAGFLKQCFYPVDLEYFQKALKLPVKPIVKIVGMNEEKKTGIEADLDVEYISAIGNPCTSYISLLKYIAKLANSGDRPHDTVLINHFLYGWGYSNRN